MIRASAKYRPQYAEIARRPQGSEIQGAYRYAERLGLNYETVTFERSSPERLRCHGRDLTTGAIAAG